jgi:D-alanine-D-alanine ligase-like ATP-grasp enzyme
MPILRSLFRASRLLDIPAVLEMLRFRALRRRYYGQFWQRAAQSIGASCESWDYGYTRITRGGMTVIARLGDLRLDDHLTLDLMGNKVLTYKLLAEQGCEVPRHARFSLTNLEPALSLLETTGRPLVIKPVSGTGGGQGVITGIADPWSLRKAALIASRFDPGLIAEEQIEGHSYRLLFADGRFLDAVRRDPPRVVGDGRSSIRKLVSLENAERLRGLPFTALSPLQIDRDARNYLKAQQLSPSHVPAAGEIVTVKRAANQNRAAENIVVSTLVHPATVAECARLAVNLGVRLAGVDIIARDISKPLGRGNGLIGEINTTPGLHHHDLVAERSRSVNIAGQVLDHMFTVRSGVVQLDKVRSSLLHKVAG